MLAYKDGVENLYSYSVAEFTRRQDLANRIESRTAANGWGITERDDDAAASPGFASGNRGAQRPGSRPGRETDSPISPLLPLPDQGEDESSVLASLGKRLRDLEGDFRKRVNVLLGDLAYQPDTDMRFLGVVMNFNDVYRPVRRHHHHHRRREGRERERVPRDGGAGQTSVVQGGRA